MAVVPVTVPSVGESISEGTLARWLKPDGAAVEAGEALFELETEKATTNVPAPSSGALQIKIGEGETVQIGSTVGTIDPAGTPRGLAPQSAQPAPTAAKAEGPAPAAAKGAAQAPATTKGTAAAPSPAAVAGAPAAAPRAAGAGVAVGTPERASQGSAGSDRPDGASPPLSPAVRRLVAEQGIDVAHVPATGPGGRITKGDVIAYLDAPGPAPVPANVPRAAAPAETGPPAAAAAATAGPRETRERMSTLRQRIAQRLLEVQQTAAILTTFNEADLSRVIALRTQFKESFQKKHGVPLGFMSFFVKASIEALKAFPAVNARIEGNEIVYSHYFDIGVAVSTERGLMVPVIRGADRLSFAAIEQAVATFAAKARDGTISVDDLRGGTFTITNGGIFGSLLSTPILNPPQSGILGMHAIKSRPVVVADEIVARPMMYVALSYDHRLIDGREAVGFLVKVKDCIENPERIMFEV